MLVKLFIQASWKEWIVENKFYFSTDAYTEGL